MSVGTKNAEELRVLAQGIHPAVLTDLGLADAIRAIAARSPVSARVRDVSNVRGPNIYENETVIR